MLQEFRPCAFIQDLTIMYALYISTQYMSACVYIYMLTCTFMYVCKDGNHSVRMYVYMRKIYEA